MTKWCPQCRKEVGVRVKEKVILNQVFYEYHCPQCNQFLGSDVEDLRDRDEHGFDKSS